MKKISHIILLLLFSTAIYAQKKDHKNTINLNKVNQERLFVHLNSSFLFTGEYLYFKIYCLDTKSLSSEISKIAYLDIINKEKEKVYSGVFQLENGVGYGDFFIPVKIASGNYKLLAYTNWMQNNKEEKFYSQDIFIVNPYTSHQEIVKESSKDNNKQLPNYNSNIVLSKSKFKKRDFVDVKLPNLKKGSYSVSVKLKDSVPYPKVISATGFHKNLVKNSGFESNIKSIPEVRGKLIKGNIQSNNNLNLKNSKIALTVPGNDYYFKIINSDSDGNFITSVDQNFEGEEAYLQILDNSDKFNYEVKLEEYGAPVPSEIKFSDYHITPDMEQMILDRSIRNQIENAYFNLKPDTVKIEKEEYLFTGLDRISYHLDEYKRFKTLKETFIEVVQYSRIRTTNSGYEVKVLGYPPKENFDGEALLIVDGFPIKDKERFIENYPAAKVDKIEIIRDKVFLGGLTYKGVVFIETIEEDFIISYKPDYVKKFRLTSGNMRKNYFKQVYDKRENDNLPDFRTQLLWKPFLNNSGSFNFYTSDVMGDFEISIQGFTNEGEPVSLYKSFMVE